MDNERTPAATANIGKLEATGLIKFVFLFKNCGRQFGKSRRLPSQPIFAKRCRK